MNRFSVGLLAAILPVFAAWSAGELKITADRIVADRNTQALVASGNVVAVSHPYRLMSPALSRDADGRVTFTDPTAVTTCTNAGCALHWRAEGEASFHAGHSVGFRNLWVYANDYPVFWLPYWHQPLDTEYGWRVMPGYTGRWGAYLLSKYVYHLAGDPSGEEGSLGLRGATRLDLRYKNGVALGQSLRWRLGDLGEGFVKGYFAWDENYDRYRDHWNNPKKWNYRNWGSTVDYERYAFEFGHRWEATERDSLRLRAAVFSDSHFKRDFLRNSLFNNRNAYAGYDGNEIAWEHHETRWAAGASVSGPLNDFYEGVSRLPEFTFDAMPQPVWGLPLNYESQTRAGYLSRQEARYGAGSKMTPFSHRPGPWANYNTFRLDSYHRLTAPFRAWDVVSVVPRAGVRATYWGESGRTVLDGYGRAGETGRDLLRTVVEGGVTFAARGTAWVNDRWQHLLEPYADVLLQEASYAGDRAGDRPYVFDSYDASIDWEDQFAGRSRLLPYSWRGVTPGVRNAFRRADEKGALRTVFDFDLYAALQFNEASWTQGDRYVHVAELGEPNIGDASFTVVPGLRLRFWMEELPRS
jgi:lipopolysaccharide assembly outer membrane protein LptD (OstA)